MLTKKFFNQTTCDRCGGRLDVRTMSWFTTETICLDCSRQEAEIKKVLRARGYDDALEGCGHVPTLGET